MEMLEDCLCEWGRCILYKIITVEDCDGDSMKKLEVLMVTLQRRHGLLFPKVFLPLTILALGVFNFLF